MESVKYDPDTTTFDSEVEKVAAVNPDFVMLCAYPETGSGMLKTAYEKGYMENIGWLLTEGLMCDELADMVGKDKAGNYIIAGLKGTTPDQRAAGPAYNAFKQNYTAEYGKEPIRYCSNIYDAVAVIALAMEKAGDASSGTAIRDSLRGVANPPGKEVSDIGEALRIIREGLWDINYQGASDDLTFDENGDVEGSYCEWFIADNGSIVLGNPIEMKGPVVMPTPSPSPSPSPTPTIAPTPTPTPEEGVPGFEAVFAIAGLLAVAYLLRRRG